MDFDVNLVNQDMDTPATPPATPPAEQTPPATPPPTDPATHSSSEKPAPETPPAPPVTPPAPATPPAPGATESGTPAVPPTEPAPPAGTEQPPSSPAPTVPAQDDAINAAKQAAQQEFLTKLGVSSFEELQEKMKPPVVETPEQQAQRLRQYNADLDAYAIKNNLITKDEIVQLETLKKADPQSVVFTKFSEQYKAAHAEATPEEVTAAFRLQYHLDSDTPAFRAYGEGLIKTQYDSLVHSLEGKYTTAKETFDSEVQQRSQLPAFKTFIKTSLDAFVPTKLDLVTDGEYGASLEVDSQTMRAEVEKLLATNETFAQFTAAKGDVQQLRSKVEETVRTYLIAKNFETIKKTIWEAGKAAGLKQGSVIGATNPFPLNQGAPTPPPLEVGITKEDDAKLGSLFG